MACKLNTEQALQVYSLLYKDIMDDTTPFDLDKFVKEIYELVPSKDKALLYAQAIPDILNLVSQDDAAIEKLVELDFDFNKLAKMRVRYNNLDNVSKDLAEKKRSKSEVDAEIKEINKSRKNQPTVPSEKKDGLLWSYNENQGAKIVFPWATTSQVAYAANPEEVSDYERNKLDPEKKLFYEVVKDLVYIARQRESDTNEVMYDGVSMAMTAMLNTDIPAALLTTDDRNFLEKNPDYVGIVAMITDSKGAPVYFDEEGNVVPEGTGRVIYQYLRQVNLVNDKLLLSNRSKRHYNLVEPEVIASRLVKQMESLPGAKKVSKKFFNDKVKEIREKQEDQMNALYNLRNFIQEEGTPVLLPITGGSFGIPTDFAKTMTLSEANLSLDDVKKYEQITTGPNRGKQFIMISTERPGTTIDQQVFLQRGDITSEQADKIAEVLTTKAKLRGKELTPEERQTYFEIFINNSIPKGSNTNRDRITAKKRVVDNVPRLVVKIKGKEISQEDLYTPETRDMIKNHLMNAVDFKGVKTYPANVHFNNKYKNRSFNDYEISGDTITQSNKKYWDFISPYIKIEYQTIDNAYFNGLNAYLNYSIPTNLLPASEEVYQIGRPQERDKTDIEKRFEREKKKKKDKEAPKEKVTAKIKSKAKPKPETKKQAVDKAVGKKTLLDDILGQKGSKLNSKKLKREKAYLREVFTSKKDLDAAETWWSNSPLSKHISLNRITEIVNSDAYATWQNYGITLYEADGGTSLDIYHEAWHGFSQLFLTQGEKRSLYNDLMKNDKWKNKTFLDIEEDLAEDFRNYAISKGKQKKEGVVGRIFRKVYNFLKSLFKGVTKNDVITKPSDIPVVKELFDKLYRASENPEILANLTPSMNNVMFTELNRLKTINEDFTIDESVKAAGLVDNLISNEIKLFNENNNTTAGGLRILKNTDNKIALYQDINDKIIGIRDRYQMLYDETVEENDALKNPNVTLERDLLERLDLLNKIVDNFGDPVEAFESDVIKGSVIEYSLEKSIFKVLGDQYIEIEDPTNLETTELFKKDDGNTISARELAGQDTMMLLASIIKVVKNEDGNFEQETDYFGVPQIQDLNKTWNRLAKILQGSFNDQDIFNRLVENSENYPDIEQLLSLLPNPAAEYADGAEFDLETSFWQDFKKPRIPYIQLNLNESEDTYSARIARANFDVYQVTRDWEVNFKVSDETTNKYVTKEKTRPILNIKKVIKDFGTPDGQFNYNKANSFLRAIGVELDMSSVAIQNIVNNKIQPFAVRFGIDQMYRLIQKVDAMKDKDARFKFAMNPLKGLLEGVGKDKNEDVRGRMRVLAELQNMYSDKFSNFSVTNPEKSRVWEHFVDSTITRMVTSMNYAESWQELTGVEDADPNQLFKHMYWMNTDNNTMTQFSVLLNSIFDLDPMSDTYGEKKENNIVLQNVAGTQLIDDNNNSEGSNTSSMDSTSKLLQEFHTMLLSGVEEFMRHASKNTAMGITVSDKVDTYDGKSAAKLYVDTQAFLPGAFGESKGVDIMTGYLSGEVNRIVRFKSNKNFENIKGYNRKIKNRLGQEVMAGAALTAFDDILREDTQRKIYELVNEAVVENNPEYNFYSVLESDLNLLDEVRKDIEEYFTKVTKQTNDRLSKASYIDQALLDKFDLRGYTLTPEQLQEVLVKAYVYNSWIHKFETTILAYGDAVQYNHAKEEFHKRNAGLAAGGRSFRSDLRAQSFVNSKALFPKLYASRLGSDYERTPYDGTLNTAIIKELEREESPMYKEYRDHLESVYYKRLKNKSKAKKLAKVATDEYLGMKVGDGQGYVTFESYRMLKKLENNWTDNQERLYRKVALGENINMEDVIEYFPPYKLQYFGNIENKGLPVNSFHKFSLAPLIPGVAKENSPLHQMHLRMMEQDVDYATFESGSKISHIGSGDAVLNLDGTFNNEVEFTKNVIYAEYLKNQTEVNPSYKGKSVFSTQMRKLILEGLYTQGVIDTTDESKITSKKVKRYLDHVSDYTDLMKYELLEEIGYKEDGKNNFVPKGPGSTGKLINLIRTNLEREDVLSDDLIEFIDVFDSGELLHDTSFHPDAAKIEKVLLSIINKRIIKPKIKGEPLVQKSSALYGIDLPTYYRDKKKGNKTAAMKVAIAMQGDYYNLLNLKYSETAGSIEFIKVTDENGVVDMKASLARLNEKIKDDAWLDANNGENRKAITLVGVRIPVQGLNSMEFAEVYEFLTPQASNIVVVPEEIVAKSGGDFDIDKLTFFMNNLDALGKPIEALFSDTNALKQDVDKNGLTSQKIKQQKAGLENEMINDIKEILEMPHNYASLITPNGTFLLKDIAETLATKVMDYDPKTSLLTEQREESISPTRIFEPLYNLYKHESNAVGKRTLGLGAVENTFNVIMNAAGAKMPETITVGMKKERRKVNLFLRHHKFGDTDQISLSNQFDVDGVNKIADVISQMMNGWVDVEKDAWIFFIQGNYEVAPQLLYLVKSGVPVEEAIYFVSNPLVRDYVEQQRLGKSTFNELLGTKPESPGFNKRRAASKVIGDNMTDILSDKSSNKARNEKGEELLDKIFEGRKEKSLTLSEMKSVVNNNNRESELAKAMFLHYLSIEAQVGGLTALKLSSNPDTSTKSTISDVEQTEANLDQIKVGDHAELLESFMNDSIISSFFNGPLAISLSKALFNLRFNKGLSDFLIAKDDRIKKLIPGTFPNKETFSTVFRNDLVSFLFQNQLKRFKLDESYSGLELKKTSKIKKVSKLDRGAFVKDGIMYVDETALENEFASRAWEEGSEADNSYESRNMFALNPGTFMRNGGKNFNEYLKFVLERETIRSIYPLSELSKTKEFTKELDRSREKKPDLSSEKLVRYTYEKMISHKALDNTLNIYHTFFDSEYSMGVRYSELMAEFPELKSQFEVLEKLMLDTDEKQSVYNLYIADKDFNNDLSNLYNKNLKDLSNPGIAKVSDPEDNKRISDFFNKLNLFAFMQTGLNKEKLSITNVVDYRPFVEILEQGEAALTNTLNTSPNKFLDNFYEMFLHQNERRNPYKKRFKDYLSTINYEEPSKIKDVPVPTEGRLTDPILEETQDETVETSNRLGLRDTSKSRVYTYNDFGAQTGYYENLANANKDVVFIHNSTINELQQEYTINFGGQGRFVEIAEDMSIDIPTGNERPNDAMANTKFTYDSIKALYERRIDTIKEVYNSGVNIAFPETGFGSNLPQELFVYLSKRLFEEFGYLNPGSTMYDSVQDLVLTTQGISDAEILAQLNLEEDPFKC
jgi:hypothetical protein